MMKTWSVTNITCDLPAMMWFKRKQLWEHGWTLTWLMWAGHSKEQLPKMDGQIGCVAWGLEPMRTVKCRILKCRNSTSRFFASSAVTKNIYIYIISTVPYKIPISSEQKSMGKWWNMRKHRWTTIPLSMRIVQHPSATGRSLMKSCRKVPVSPDCYSRLTLIHDVLQFKDMVASGNLLHSHWKMVI